MNKTEFKKRTIKKKDILEEVWLNQSPRRADGSELIRLYAVGKTTLFPAQTHVSFAKLNSEWGIAFVCGGEGNILIKGKQQRKISKDDALFLHPDCNSRIQLSNPGRTDVVRTYLIIERNIYIEQMFNVNNINIIHMKNPERIYECVNRILKLVQNGSAALEEELSVCLFECLTFLSRDCSVEPKFSSPYSHILETISHFPQNYPSLKALMQKFGVSREKLTEIFRNSVNMSPMEYVIWSRLYNSCWLLSYTETSIEEIAAMNGYKTAAFYTRSFKSRFGKSPSAYRRENKYIAG